MLVYHDKRKLMRTLLFMLHQYCGDGVTFLLTYAEAHIIFYAVNVMTHSPCKIRRKNANCPALVQKKQFCQSCTSPSCIPVVSSLLDKPLRLRIPFLVQQTAAMNQL